MAEEADALARERRVRLSDHLDLPSSCRASATENVVLVTRSGREPARLEQQPVAPLEAGARQPLRRAALRAGDELEDGADAEQERRVEERPGRLYPPLLAGRRGADPDDVGAGLVDACGDRGQLVEQRGPEGRRVGAADREPRIALRRVRAETREGLGRRAEEKVAVAALGERRQSSSKTSAPATRCAAVPVEQADRPRDRGAVGEHHSCAAERDGGGLVAAGGRGQARVREADVLTAAAVDHALELVGDLGQRRGEHLRADHVRRSHATARSRRDACPVSAASKTSAAASSSTCRRACSRSG